MFGLWYLGRDKIKTYKTVLEYIAATPKAQAKKMDEDSDFHTRQFNPLAGINEDPITGVAAGALGCYIVKHRLSEKKTFVVEQGYAITY